MARPENSLGLQEAMLTWGAIRTAVCHEQLLPSQLALHRQQPAFGLVWPFVHCPLPEDPRNTRARSQDQLHTSLRLLRPICSCRQPRPHPKCRFCSKISAQAAFPFPFPALCSAPHPAATALRGAHCDFPRAAQEHRHSMPFTALHYKRDLIASYSKQNQGTPEISSHFHLGPSAGTKSASRPQKWFQI